MMKLRLGLVVLSVLQYITLESFWDSDFYWFFIWIVVAQINWFYLEEIQYKQMALIVGGLLAVINAVIVPQLPIILLTLYIMDVWQEFNRMTGRVLLGIFAVALIMVWTTFGQWPEVNELALLLAFILTGIWAIDLYAKNLERDKQMYQHILAQDELQSNTQTLKRQIDSMQEVYTLKERNRISRDLHDSLGHVLSTLVVQLAAIQKLTEKTSPQASDMLGQLHEFTKEGLTNVRTVIHQMKPLDYERIAFIDQLSGLVKEFETNSGIQVYFNHNNPRWRLSEKQEALVYRAIQEFTGNSAKHSDATEIRIQMHFTDSDFILTMKDNGKGTDNIVPQMGLTGMSERTKLLGGKVQVQSAPHAGFRIRIVLPKGGYHND